MRGDGPDEKRALAAQAAAHEYAEAQAEAAVTLDPETAAVLQDQHAAATGRAIKQAEVNQRLREDAYEQLKKEEAGKAIEHFVRRGAVHKRCDATRLRPGEQYFAKRASGGWEFVGVINANGELPEQEIQL
jgi:hypothetical protein